MKPDSFQITTNIIRATDPESSRYALNGIKHLAADPTDETAILVATDGRCAAIVETTSTLQRTELVHPHALPSKKTDFPRHGGATIESSPGLAVHILNPDDPKKTRRHVYPDGRFPKTSDCMFALPAPEHRHAITLDAAILARLAEAITSRDHVEEHGTLSVTIFIDTDPGKRSTRRAQDRFAVVGNAGVGLIMSLTGDHQDHPDNIETDKAERYEAIRERLTKQEDEERRRK
jgi:hypothetical protein